MENKLLVLTAILALYLSTATAVPHSFIQGRDNSTLVWSSCFTQTAANVDCASLKVPLNHKDPYGPTITLAMSRIKAPSSHNYKGVIFTNFGGPGESSALGVARLGPSIETSPGWSEVHTSYDIIGIDNRGEGFSEPLKCNADLFNALGNALIVDQESFERQITKNKAFAQSCANMTGPLFYHMGTDQAILDYDLIRQALGQDKFNFLGYSGGTQIAQEYIGMFPHRVGRIVMDAVTQRSLSTEMELITGAAGPETTLNCFFQWCNTTTECALFGQDQPSIFDQVFARASSGYLKAGPATVSIRSFAIATISRYLHDGDTVGAKANFFKALKQAYGGNGTLFYMLPIITNTTYGGNATDYSTANIWCSDRAARNLSANDFRAIFTATEALSPHLKGWSVEALFEMWCVGWPIQTKNPPRTLDTKKTKNIPPVLIVGSFYDPATPFPWALDVRAQLPTAVSIYRNGTGHTSFSKYKEISDIIAAYLVNGTLPEDGAVYSTL